MSNRLHKRALSLNPRERQSLAVRAAGVRVESLEERFLLSGHPLRTISGRIFNDLNGNGTRQPREHWLKGVAVYLDLNNNGIEDPGESATVTNKAGTFTFRKLQRGTYTVVAIPPAGDAATKPLNGIATVNVTKHSVLNLRFGEHAAPTPPQVTSPPYTTPPSADLNAPPITTAGFTPYRFTVTWTDPAGVDVTSFGDGNIVVTAGNGFYQPAGLVALDAITDGSPRTATYQIPAPATGWTVDIDGTYTVNLVGGQIRDTLGNTDAATALGTFAVEIPSAATGAPTLIGGVDGITPDNNARADSELTFNVQDTTAGAELTLEADGTPIGSAIATAGSTNVSTNGSTKLADGPHRFSVTQTLGNDVESTSTPTTITVNTTGPTDALQASPIISGGGSTYTFIVTYTDDTEVSAASITGGNLLVTAPSGQRITPTLDSLDADSDGPTRIATYEINAPGGTWSAANDGTYTVTLLANEVFDVVHNAAAGRVIGTFAVSIGKPLSPVTGTPSLLPVSDTGVYNDDDITDLNNSSHSRELQFSVPGVENGAVVTIYSDGTPIGSTTASGTTAVVITNGSVALSSAAHLITASQIAPGQGPSDASPALGIVVDTQAPTAASSPAQVDTFGGTSYSFPVVYTDNIAVDAASLETGNVIVAGPNGFSQAAALESVNSQTNGSPRTATYVITPPGGSWSPADNGQYTISVAAAQVFDTAGNASPPGPIATFTVNAGLVSSPIPSAPGLLPGSDTGESDTDGLTNLNNVSPASTLQFNVGGTIAEATVAIYSDGTLIGAAVATAASTVVTTNGTYKLVRGPHTITARQTVPSDGQSSDSPGSTITIDPTPPIAAALTTPNVTTAGATSYTFAVTYADAVAVEAATVGNGNIVVSVGNVTLAATFVSATPNTDSSSITATYQITPPGGSWNSADNGVYHVNLQGGQIQDTAGNTAAATNVGSFTVNVVESPTAAPGAPNLLPSSDTGTSQNDDLTNLNNASAAQELQFSVANTIPGATVTIYSDETPIGAVVASTSTTTVTTTGDTPIADGVHTITARQQSPGQPQSTDSAGLSITIETTPPTAIANLTDVTVSAATYTFSVTYSDDIAIDPSTLGGGNIIITGPNGFEMSASLVSVDDPSLGSPRTGTYSIDAPNGGWTNPDNGVYTVTLEPGQVLDTAGNAAATGTLGTFNVNVP